MSKNRRTDLHSSNPSATTLADHTETFSPKNLIFLPIPLILSFLLSFFLKEDQANFLIWWFVLFLFGIAAFPLAARIFSSFTGSGYGFSKAIGILSVAFVLWTLAYIRILPFNRPVIVLLLLILAGISWGIPKTRNAAFSALSSATNARNIAFEESIFVLALFAWCIIKGTRPEINGEEKFMDFAFLNALVRTEVLPAPDPWLAGRAINYYYFGQYVYALIAKLSSIKTGVAYTLSMCTCFAMSFGMSYSLGSLFIDGASQKGVRSKPFFRVAAGLLSAFTVSIFGNSHAFFYYEEGGGNSLLRLFQSWGIQVGRTDSFFYPDSTRFIGHNPESEILSSAMTVIKEGDRTIHEFPCYSYILGDLHAHVISMMVVMLILGILYALYFRAKSLSADSEVAQDAKLSLLFKNEVLNLLQPELLIVGVLLGIATMTNYWDFLIYFIVSCMVLLIYSAKVSKKFASIGGSIFFVTQTAMILMTYLYFSSSPYLHTMMQILVLLVSLFGASLLPCALTRTGLGMSMLFSLSTISALTFQSNFDMIANSLAVAPHHTSIYQFFILWCTHILFALVIIVITICTIFNKGTEPNDKESAMTENTISRFFSKLNPSDLFMSGVSVVGMLLLAAPEVFYVMDIYGGSYKRANTMFKFTFAAFIVLSLVIGYTALRVFSLRWRSNVGRVAIISVAICLTAALIIPGTYPIVSIDQRTGPITLNDSFTLDGTKALIGRDSPQLPGASGELSNYAAAIDWLNSNIPGTTIICEAYGPSYTDNCVVSAYTGLPTIIGWQTHEWLWRFQGIVDDEGKLVSDPNKADVWRDILTPRNTDVTSIYTATDATTASAILAKYNVRYLIVGNLERTQYPTIDDELLKSLGTVVFEKDSVYIVAV
jgi:YYY domain-containing protein